MKRWLVLGGAVAAIIAVVFGLALMRTAPGEASWDELDSVEELRERFNRDEGSIRIVLLLSPT